MMITVYHGSPLSLDVFEIGEELSKREISSLAEGLGIYMTEDKKMAADYGRYLYEIQLNENDITDFTNASVIRNIIQSMAKDTDIPIFEEIEVEGVIDAVLEGNLKITVLYKEINDLLESNESFYMRHQDMITHEDDCLFEKVKVSFHHHLKDVLKYNDRSFDEPVFLCFRHPEKLKIINRFEM